MLTYLVYESPERGEHVPEGRFRLADFQEGQVNVKHFLHQGVVTVAVQQLGLTHTETLGSIFPYRDTQSPSSVCVCVCVSVCVCACVSACVRACVCVCVCTDLEALSEKSKDIQDAEGDLRGDVSLQHSLMVDLCFGWPRP